MVWKIVLGITIGISVGLGLSFFNQKLGGG